MEHHSSFEVLDEDKEINDANISLISKRLAFENWDYPIIVTTSVQFLNHYLVIEQVNVERFIGLLNLLLFLMRCSL